MNRFECLCDKDFTDFQTDGSVATVLQPEHLLYKSISWK